MISPFTLRTVHSALSTLSLSLSLSLSLLSSTTKSLIGLGCCGKEGTGCVFYLDTIPLRSRKLTFFCGLFVVLADTDFSCFVFCIFFDMNLHLHPILWRISTGKKTMNANNMYCKNNKLAGNLHWPQLSKMTKTPQSIAPGSCNLLPI